MLEVGVNKHNFRKEQKSKHMDLFGIKLQYCLSIVFPAGLTLQQSTDVRVLKRELEKLERQLKELTIAHRTRYSPAQVKDHLKGQLEHKVELRDQLAEQLDLMKAKRYKLKIAVEAAQAYLKIQPPHQTIGEAVVTAIIRANNQVSDRSNCLLCSVVADKTGNCTGFPSMYFTAYLTLF